MAIESSRKRTPASGAVGSWLAPAALLLALAAASWPLVVPGRVLVTDDGFVSDATGAGLPFRAVLGEALRGRSSLFWCPGIYCGYPLHADPEAGFLYPPNWLLACLGDPIGGIHLGLFAHLLVAAAGLLLVLRDGGVPAGPAAYGALAFGGGGFLLAHLKHVSMVHTAAWLPWLLAGAARMRRPETARSGFVLAAVSAAAMGLASHPQLAYIGILAVAAFHVLGEIIPGEDGRQRKARPGWRAAARPSVLLLAALLAGLAAAAVQIVPAAFLALGSERAAQRGAFFAERIPLEPRNLLTWFAARAVGMPGEGTYEGRGLHWEDYSYQGLLTVPLALAGLAAGRRRRSVRVWAVLGALALLLALGRRAGLFALALRLLPGLAWFRFPSRFLVVSELAVAVLAAHGLAAAAGTAAKRSRAWGRLLPAVAVAVLAVDLAAAQRPLNGYAPRARWLEPPATVTDVAPPGRYLGLGAREAHYVAYQRARGWSDLEPFVVQRRFLQPSLNLHFGVRAADGYANPVPRTTARLWGSHYASGLLQESFSVSEGRVTLSPAFFTLARMAEVKTVLSLWPLDDARLAPLAARPPVFSYLLPAPLPHARFVPAASTVTSLEAAVARLRAPGFDPAVETVLLGPRAAGAIDAEGASGDVAVTRRTDTELDCTVTADVPGHLVVAESFDPGWRARVDGVARPVLLADAGFQAVEVGAGRHEVRLRYRPRGLALGLAASGLGGLAIGLAAVRFGVRR